MTTRAQSRTHYVAISLGQGLVRVRPGPAERTGGYGARASDRAAEAELELYFAAAPGIWGLHGTAFGATGGPTAWDAKAILSLVPNDFEGRERGRLTKVAPTVERLRKVDPHAWRTAAMVFAPRGWPTLIAPVMNRGEKRGTLAGLLSRSAKLRRLFFEDRRRAGAEPDPFALVLYAEERAEQIAASVKRRYSRPGQLVEAGNVYDHEMRIFFAPLIAEAEAKLRTALAAYDVLRIDRVRAEAQAKRDLEHKLRHGSLPQSTREVT